MTGLRTLRAHGPDKHNDSHFHAEFSLTHASRKTWSRAGDTVYIFFSDSRFASGMGTMCLLGSQYKKLRHHAPRQGASWHEMNNTQQ